MSLLYSPTAIACKMHCRTKCHATQNIRSAVHYQRNKAYLFKSQSQVYQSSPITDFFSFTKNGSFQNFHSTSNFLEFSGMKFSNAKNSRKFDSLLKWNSMVVSIASFWSKSWIKLKYIPGQPCLCQYQFYLRQTYKK